MCECVQAPSTIMPELEAIVAMLYGDNSDAASHKDPDPKQAKE